MNRNARHEHVHITIDAYILVYIRVYTFAHDDPVSGPYSRECAA